MVGAGREGAAWLPRAAGVARSGDWSYARGMDTPVLHDRLPFVPWMDPATARLPGMRPCGPDDWLRRDEVFAGQMARRDWLIATRQPLVHALLPEGRGAAEELYALTLDRLGRDAGYQVERGSVLRPDGLRVTLDARFPLVTLGRLVQEDLCLLMPGESGHVLVGAVLCFPASWTLAEKIGRALLGVHRPVAEYPGDLERRVQRLFDGLRAGQVLERFNAFAYEEAELHQPRREGEHRPRSRAPGFVRSERQCLLKLPVSGAVVFSIHTYMAPIASLTAEERAGLVGDTTEPVRGLR